LNTGLVQVAFKDKTELYVCKSTKLVTYVNKQSEVETINYSEAIKLPSSSDIFKRLKYTKEVLKNASKVEDHK
jgi:hypothetical protein